MIPEVFVAVSGIAVQMGRLAALVRFSIGILLHEPILIPFSCCRQMGVAVLQGAQFLSRSLYSRMAY